jgi:1,4-dihydroxy-2-naphthoate octaprenyltransferase
VLYVNEIPDRPGDAKAGKRTLPVRLSKGAVIAGYTMAIAATYLSIVAGVAFGLLPVPTVIALATIPIALKVRKGIEEHYESPYTLMAVMGQGVNLHLFTGMLLVVAYVIAIVADRVMTEVPAFLSYL